jgi:hypothetical protein
VKFNDDPVSSSAPKPEGVPIAYIALAGSLVLNGLLICALVTLIVGMFR